MKLALITATALVSFASSAFANGVFTCEILKFDKGSAAKIGQIKANPQKGEWTVVSIGNRGNGIFCGSLGSGFGCQVSSMRGPIGAPGTTDAASSTVVVENSARMLDYIVRDGTDTFEASCKR